MSSVANKRVACAIMLMQNNPRTFTLTDVTICMVFPFDLSTEWMLLPWRDWWSLWISKTQEVHGDGGLHCWCSEKVFELESLAACSVQ